MPLHMILHEQVDHGAGPFPSLGIWRCREAQASAVHRDAGSLQIWYVGVRQLERTCGGTLETPQLTALSGTAPASGCVAP